MKEIKLNDITVDEMQRVSVFIHLYMERMFKGKVESSVECEPRSLEYIIKVLITYNGIHIHSADRIKCEFKTTDLLALLDTMKKDLIEKYNAELSYTNSILI